MLMRMLLLTAVIGGGLVFLSGAWPGPVAPSTPITNSDFVSQTFPLNATIIGSGVEANDLLKKALDNLDQQRSTWLRTKIRQTMSHPESRFVAEGYLQRGPNHCAHLEMDLDTNGNKARVLIVSDGASVASVRETGDAKPIVDVYPFPPTDDASVKNAFLRTMNCDGPAAALTEIFKCLRDGKLQTGLLMDRRVIQITGEIDGNSASVLRRCRVYLDAETLWPCQIEWFDSDSLHPWRATSRVEYSDPEINQQLSLSECERLFSYHP